MPRSHPRLCSVSLTAASATVTLPECHAQSLYCNASQCTPGCQSQPRVCCHCPGHCWMARQHVPGGSAHTGCNCNADDACHATHMLKDKEFFCAPDRVLAAVACAFKVSASKAPDVVVANAKNLMRTLLGDGGPLLCSLAFACGQAIEGATARVHAWAHVWLKSTGVTPQSQRPHR